MCFPATLIYHVSKKSCDLRVTVLSEICRIDEQKFSLEGEETKKRREKLDKSSLGRHILACDEI